jgi:hypothetical protein
MNKPSRLRRGDTSERVELTLPGSVFRAWEDEALRQSKALGKKIKVQDCIRAIISDLDPVKTLIKWEEARFTNDLITCLEKHGLIVLTNRIRNLIFQEGK